VTLVTIEINADERVSFVGTTGSGKTVLADYLLNYGGDRVLVIDPKHTFQKEGFEDRRRFPFMGKDYKMIYRPNSDDDKHMADLLREAFKRGNTRIYVDELATTARFFPESADMLEDIARTGRERYISLWCATQRPRHVPVSLFTESEIWFVFLLRDPRDRRHVSGYVGDEIEGQMPLYHFWYVRPGMERPKLMTLDLDQNRLMEVSKHGYETVG
jgi:energy-coupling factor transporter ATP-binding protein EcfA2